jgi:hypothetical protein
MKNKRIYYNRVFLAIICAAVFFIVYTPVKEMDASQSQKTEASPSETITIYAKLFKKHTKGPVTFTHGKHVEDYKIACQECHHVYQNGKNVWKKEMKVEKCEVCHNEPTVKREHTLPPDLKKKNLKLAFHNNCRACHKKTKKENPETKAPTKCGECHKK